VNLARVTKDGLQVCGGPGSIPGGDAAAGRPGSGGRRWGRKAGGDQALGRRGDARLGRRAAHVYSGLPVSQQAVWRPGDRRLNSSGGCRCVVAGRNRCESTGVSSWPAERRPAQRQPPHSRWWRWSRGPGRPARLRNRGGSYKPYPLMSVGTENLSGIRARRAAAAASEITGRALRSARGYRRGSTVRPAVAADPGVLSLEHRRAAGHDARSVIRFCRLVGGGRRRGARVARARERQVRCTGRPYSAAGAAGDAGKSCWSASSSRWSTCYTKQGGTLLRAAGAVSSRGAAGDIGGSCSPEGGRARTCEWRGGGACWPLLACHTAFGRVPRGPGLGAGPAPPTVDPQRASAGCRRDAVIAPALRLRRPAYWQAQDLQARVQTAVNAG